MDLLRCSEMAGSSRSAEQMSEYRDWMSIMMEARSTGVLLSGRTLHGVSPENRSWRKGLGFNLCVAPPHDCVVQNFGVTEFTEFTMVFQSTPEETEKMERLEVCTIGCTMVNI